MAKQYALIHKKDQLIEATSFYREVLEMVIMEADEPDDLNIIQFECDCCEEPDDDEAAFEITIH